MAFLFKLISNIVKSNILTRLKVICCSVECVFAAYLADFCRCKDHVKDSCPAGNHSCGDCIGQRYHQEAQVTKGDKNLQVSRLQFSKKKNKTTA